MIDRFLYWGNHVAAKSGKIKGSCQPPLLPGKCIAFACVVRQGWGTVSLSRGKKGTAVINLWRSYSIKEVIKTMVDPQKERAYEEYWESALLCALACPELTSVVNEPKRRRI